LGNGTSPASALKLVAHPASVSGKLEGHMCGGGVDYPEAGGICIKSSSCACNQLGPPYHDIDCEEPVPVSTATWSAIKALYR
jgi:hypothetical protein